MGGISPVLGLYLLTKWWIRKKEPTKCSPQQELSSVFVWSLVKVSSPISSKGTCKSIRGEAIHQCEYCEYRSADWSMKTHVKTKHSKELPFKCDICLWTFSDTKEVQQHALIHQESKPHHCLHCDRKSENSSDLTQFQFTRRTAPIKCDMCDKGFHGPLGLRKHVAAPKATIVPVLTR